MRRCGSQDAICIRDAAKKGCHPSYRMRRERGKPDFGEENALADAGTRRPGISERYSASIARNLE